MSFPVTALSVKIASLGDAALELFIVREVIGDWNARHALARRQVLLPLYEEVMSEVAPSDLLVAFFCVAEGISSQRARSSNAEIEKHLEAGAPALIYVSEARADLARIDDFPTKELSELKKRYDLRATVESYGDEKEFRAKFARQLEAAINAHFKPEVSPQPEPQAAPTLSAPAQTLLSEACEDFEAYIGRIKIGNTLKIQANGKQLVEAGKPEAEALWDAAFHELLTGGYIHDAGCNGQLFQISTKGFDFLKTIGKSPVGYIAELGGM